ncbi:MAG: lipopolysaccharide transport system ATP-binding protein [Thermoleophilaceae bacterium]|nr:lipopolysaccharide transport system ATP-binding protein [Thermoleophilaceae bacterium]
MSAARGEIVLDHATRSFALVHERPRTLKELFVRRGGGGRSRVQALDDVSLRIAPGEAVGMVGRNGAGKTSTLRCLAGIVPLDSGRADCGGRVVSLLELGAGFGPDFSGRENIYLNGALHGFGREEIDARVERIIEFSELGEFIDVPVKAYSAGMYLRLGFSIVAHLDADVLLIDEILAVGDESFQRKCLARIREQMDAGATLVLVSHDPSAIERACERVVVLDGGRVAFDGSVAEGLLFYHRLLGSGETHEVPLRAGSGALGVASLELLDADARPRHMFRPGETMRVELSLAAPAPVARGVVALEVRDMRGDTLFRTDASVGPVHGRAGVSFDIARLALLGGDYDLAVAASDQDAPQVMDRLARFSVAATSDGEGVVDLRGDWTVRTEVAAP